MQASLFAKPQMLERRLLLLVGGFLCLWSAAFSLSPLVRARSLSASLRWDHWLVVAIWGLLIWVIHWQLSRWLPNRDPLLLPVAALLTGWGTLTVWRLFPGLGLRQTVWLVVAAFALWLIMRLPKDLSYLRRYKYLWLTAGLLLTGLTLLFGTNPLGAGPRMWLGCCGLYLQPSEPLKLLLVIYLAAYLAGYAGVTANTRFARVKPAAGATLLPLLAPTLLMTGLALALLVAQRDLGTATIFLYLYAVVAYFATGKRRILVSTAVALLLAGILGYILFDLVRLRVEAWQNPWADPSGRSYQIVQSLIAVANGGIIGRGPGLGNPNLVPVPHSDFIFTAISEESGLIGAITLLALVGILALRGLRAAILAPDPFRRYLAAGLSAHLAGQALLIAAGNLRLLPLTGVTFPFVSYGGSSLLTSYLALLFLLKVSDQPEENQPAPLANLNAYLAISGGLLTALAITAMSAGWWAVARSPDLLARTDNARRAIADRFVRRGAILDRNGTALAESTGTPGSLARSVSYPPLSTIIGYSHPVYGQSGLEAGVDEYLRGQQGIPLSTIIWNQLLYGQPPPGLDVRTTLDLSLQAVADQAMNGLTGALVLLEANSGQIIAMSSHPGFDANHLDQEWERLISDETAPLLNRAVLGIYPSAQLLEQLLPEGFAIEALDLPGEVASMGQTAPTELPDQITPIQLASLAAVFSNAGTLHTPWIASAVNTPLVGWVLLPADGQPIQMLEPAWVAAKNESLLNPDGWGWELTVLSDQSPSEQVAIYLGGTLETWQGTPFALALVLENSNPAEVSRVANLVWKAALSK
jgi:cell division protein FtsW (lipid II flippase)